MRGGHADSDTPFVNRMQCNVCCLEGQLVYIISFGLSAMKESECDPGWISSEMESNRYLVKHFMPNFMNEVWRNA